MWVGCRVVLLVSFNKMWCCERREERGEGNETSDELLQLDRLENQLFSKKHQGVCGKRVGIPRRAYLFTRFDMPFARITDFQV